MSIAPLHPRNHTQPHALPGGAHPRTRLRAVPAPASTPAPAPTTSTLPAVVSAGLPTPTVFGTVVDYANFDHGASTPALVGVQRAVETATATYSSVHRGNGYASRVTSQWYEEARAEVERFVGARPGDEVIFTRNTTDSFNLLARALPRDTVVIVFDTEHHATLLSWPARRTVRLPIPGSAADAEILLADALATHASTKRPTLVVLNGASNVTGEYWPLETLVPIARTAGARVALDAAQLAPHRRLDLAELDVDWVAFSGHKLYAPYGAGVLAGRADWLDAAAPYLAGGGATKMVTDSAVAWHTGPARHEAGSPNVLGAIGLAAACAALTTHADAIETHEARIGERLLTGLTAIEGVTAYDLFGGTVDRAPVVTFTIDELPSSLVSAALSAEHGIGVRDGKFCAHRLVDALLADEFDDDTPTTAVRVSAGLATTDEHVDRLLAAVAALAADGPAWDYEDRAGQGWVALDDPRNLTPAKPW